MEEALVVEGPVPVIVEALDEEWRDDEAVDAPSGAEGSMTKLSFMSCSRGMPTAIKAARPMPPHIDIFISCDKMFL